MEDKGMGEGVDKGLAGGVDVGVDVDNGEGLCECEGKDGAWRARTWLGALARAWP